MVDSPSRTGLMWILSMGTLLQEQTGPAWVPHWATIPASKPVPVWVFSTGHSSCQEPSLMWAVRGLQLPSEHLHLLWCRVLPTNFCHGVACFAWSNVVCSQHLFLTLVLLSVFFFFSFTFRFPVCSVFLLIYPVNYAYFPVCNGDL